LLCATFPENFKSCSSPESFAPESLARGQAKQDLQQDREAVSIQDMACKSVVCRESLRFM
jgi:hypothetical protein